MNYLNKSKEELVEELMELKKSFDSLTILYHQQEKIQQETEFLLGERTKNNLRKRMAWGMGEQEEEW